MFLLITKISESLKENNSDINRKAWTNYILSNNIKLQDLIKLIHEDYPIAIRFSWMLGDIAEQKPEAITTVVSYLFINREKIKIPNFNRLLTKMFYLVDIPKEIEGDAIDFMFKELMNPASIISTKRFAALALNKYCYQYPELKNELNIILQDQLGKSSASFDKLAKNIIENIR